MPTPARSAVASFYVAPNGSDSWSGARLEPNADKSDGPFATLAGARDAVRRLKTSDTNTDPVTVLVCGGEEGLAKAKALGAKTKRSHLVTRPQLNSLYVHHAGNTNSERKRISLQKPRSLARSAPSKH